MAQVTNQEYQNVKNTLNNQYTADSLQNYENAYNDYKAQGMSSKDAISKAQGLLVAKETTAPTTQETPTSTPTPTPVKEEVIVKQGETPVNTDTEIKQEGALKPLSQDYYNQTSDDAQSKIVSNLNRYKQSNPEYFTDYESFKKNFSYDARDEVQKNTLDNWYKGYQKGMELGNVPVNDLYTQYNNGQISNSDLESLRVYNPTKYAELQNQINKGSIIAAYDDDKGVDTNLSFQDMAYKMFANVFNTYMNGGADSGASQYFTELKDKMNSPEMMELSDKTTELQEQARNISDDIASMQSAVEKEYEGTGATRSKINAIVADRTYDLQQQLRTVNNEYEKYANQYNNRMQQYQNEFQLQLQEYQVNMEARNQQMKELGFAMDLMSFETPEQQQQRQWDYWVAQQEYTNGNINSKDYQTRYKAALSSVQNLLSQYEGIPMVRSAEQMAQDILKAIDNGSDLGTELTKINQLIQQKPEYKQLYNATYGTGSTTTGFGKTIKIGDMELIEYNGQWLTADQVKEMFTNGGGTAKAYDPVDASKLNNDIRGGLGNNLGKFLLKKINGMTGGQCGKYVNDYLEYIGMTGASNRYYDNELSTKLNSVNTYDPKEGVIAVFDYNHKSSDGINHGHVGIVTKVTKDGIYVRDSNYSSDERIQTRFIKKGSAEWENNLKGFFDPSQPPMNSTTEASSSFVSGSIDGVPLAYERAVRNLVPAALQNSDAEREALNTVITNSYNGGIDQSQIALTFMGFDIKNEEDKKLALDLVNTVRTLSTDTQEGIVQTISDLMNQGNYTKAVQTVENAVSQQAKAAGNYIPESSVKNTMNRVNSLSEYISGLDKSPVGVVEGTMQEWLGKISSSKAKEISNRIAAIDSTLDIKDADTRARILPQLSDQPSVFMSKLNNLNQNLLSELNGWREIYGLPDLTTAAIQNYSSRVDLYRNGGTKNDETISSQTNTITKSDIRSAIKALNLQFGLK